MRPLSVAILKAGIIPKQTLYEMNRWGLPITFVDEDEPDDVVECQNVESVVATIRDALEDSDLVQLRDTDLDIIHRYLAEQKSGKLHGLSKATIPVSFCVTELGEYAIPWISESIAEILIDPNISLRFSEKGRRIVVHFKDVRELFFGNHKAFMVCIPSEVSDDDE